ncbi:hypothetical protein [Sphingomonas montana]|uniref:hypothetical protein n=1 Tax=Sphingomonas montana TaxID=1843236 RepID=UPI00096D2FB5|nr:hypothetical protein [Sphingomonas montana]
MIQINVGDHTPIYPLWRAVPSGNRHMLTWSRERAHWIARNLPGADAYFKVLPFQKTLTSLLADKTIWLNYEDNPSRYGATSTNNYKDIAISSTAFRQGRWVVLATLIHELAHVAGAPGFSHAAEQAVLACGLGRRSELIHDKDDPRTPYEPNILGMTRSSRGTAFV